MNYAGRVLQSMKIDHEYRYCDLEVMTQLPRREVVRVCKELEKGGVIECTGEEKVKRKKERKFKTRQLPLAI